MTTLPSEGTIPPYIHQARCRRALAHHRFWTVASYCASVAAAATTSAFIVALAGTLARFVGLLR